MPAGVSWPRYLRMFGASVLSMFAGAQVVHQYYRPDLVHSSRTLSICTLEAGYGRSTTPPARRGSRNLL
uniref:Uncharacterized protein n=1 Tax=Sinocyclocheilus rhinocerous TaxID=307959 RepID=A0A673I3G1_9TELE